MTWLLDGNVLLALAIPDHPHHGRCLAWFRGIEHFATCPVTEGTLLRLHTRFAHDPSIGAAWKTLRVYHSHPLHEFWSDNFSYTRIDPTRLTGPAQVTDAWLAELARRKGARLATLDEALSVLWPDSTRLIPV